MSRHRPDGGEHDLYGWVTIEQPSRVRSLNLYVKQVDGEISAGDTIGLTMDAVTHWVARNLRDEFKIDVTDYMVNAIDPDEDIVGVL